MGDSFDKRARERRKQQKRQEKVARKRSGVKPEGITEEMTPQDFFDLDSDAPEEAETEDGEEKEDE